MKNKEFFQPFMCYFNINIYYNCISRYVREVGNVILVPKVLKSHSPIALFGKKLAMTYDWV